MSRDIQDRIALFMRHHLGRAPMVFKRLALNMDQVDEYGPPPNPAKLSDSRANGYVDLYGDESWELDALEPQVLVKLIQSNIKGARDDGRWDYAVSREEEGRTLLLEASNRWEEVAEFLG